MQQRQAFVRHGNYLMPGAITLCTLVQLDDPDAMAWIALYGAATAATIVCLQQALATPVASPELHQLRESSRRDRAEMA